MICVSYKQTNDNGVTMESSYPEQISIFMDKGAVKIRATVRIKEREQKLSRWFPTLWEKMP